MTYESSQGREKGFDLVKAKEGCTVRLGSCSLLTLLATTSKTSIALLQEPDPTSHHIPATVRAGGRGLWDPWKPLCSSQVGQKPAAGSSDMCVQLILCTRLHGRKSTRAHILLKALTPDTTRQLQSLACSEVREMSYSNHYH